MNPDFRKILDAYGHGSIWIADRESWRGKPDPWHLELLQPIGADIYLSLDWNRQPQVWSELLLKLAEGTGRLARMKLRSTEIPDIPTMTLYWARAYPKFGPRLDDSRARLIQIGLRIDSKRAEQGGARVFTSREIGAMTQQQHYEHGGQLRRRGTPSLNVPGPARRRRP